MSLVQAFCGLSLDVVGLSRRFRGRKIGVCWMGPGDRGLEADFFGLKNDRLRDFGVINRLLTGYQQVINRLLTEDVDNFWGGGWRVFGLALALDSRRIGHKKAAGPMAARLAPEGLAVGWTARRAWRWLLVALVMGRAGG